MCNDANLIDGRSSRLWSIEGAAQRQYKANRLLLAWWSLKLANVACVLVVLLDKSQEWGLQIYMNHHRRWVHYLSPIRVEPICTDSSLYQHSFGNRWSPSSVRDFVIYPWISGECIRFVLLKICQLIPSCITDDSQHSDALTFAPITNNTQ